MEYTIYDFIGNIGVVILISTYFLLIHGKIKAEDIKYSLLNLISAILITVSLMATLNISSLIIEIFWIAISLYGIWKWYQQKSNTKCYN